MLITDILIYLFKCWLHNLDSKACSSRFFEGYKKVVNLLTIILHNIFKSNFRSYRTPWGESSRSIRNHLSDISGDFFKDLEIEVSNLYPRSKSKLIVPIYICLDLGQSSFTKKRIEFKLSYKSLVCRMSIFNLNKV